MRKARSSGATLSVRQIGAILVAIALGWFALANGAVGYFRAAHPDRGALFWPNHPSIAGPMALRAVEDDLRDGGGVTEASMRRVIAFRQADLTAADSYVAVSIVRRSRGDLDGALKASSIALSRDPGNVLALIADTQNSVLADRIARTLDNLILMGQMSPQVIEQMGDVLVAVAEDEKTSQATQVAMKQSPVIASAILSTLAKDADNADKIMALAPKAGPSSIYDANARWPSILINTLLAGGEAQRARQLWLMQRQLDEKERALLLFDPEFRQSNINDSFAWGLASDTDGIADPLSGGGIDVISYGHADSILAAQSLALPPGQYRLIVDHSGQSGPGQFVWRLICKGAPDRQLSSLTLSGSGGGRPTLDFVINPACNWQSLMLTAKAPELPGQSNVRINRVDLQRLGS